MAVVAAPPLHEQMGCVRHLRQASGLIEDGICETCQRELQRLWHCLTSLLSTCRSAENLAPHSMHDRCERRLTCEQAGHNLLPIWLRHRGAALELGLSPWPSAAPMPLSSLAAKPETDAARVRGPWAPVDDDLTAAPSSWLQVDASDGSASQAARFLLSLFFCFMLNRAPHEMQNCPREVRVYARGAASATGREGRD